jgi:hypothetical protein
MKNQAKFDLVTTRAPKDDSEVGGDYYGLPWPCWGSPEVRHPGWWLGPDAFTTWRLEKPMRRSHWGGPQVSSGFGMRKSPPSCSISSMQPIIESSPKAVER